MKKVLVTGATGNVGLEVIKALHNTGRGVQVRAGVRNLRRDVPGLSAAELHFFDFDNRSSFEPALAGCHSLFLLRPPQLTDVNASIKPLLQTAVACGVQHVVFLSVQGVDKNPFIPHHKIEALIRESGLSYTFLRPAYFMQNFTTTLLPDIQKKGEIFLPAGKAKFTLVDVRDIGAVAAKIMLEPERYVNKAFDLTSADLLDFREMALTIQRASGRPVRFVSPNPIRFFIQQKKAGTPAGFILVMIMLHFLPRFQKAPPRSGYIAEITGKTPISFQQFAHDHRHLFV